MKENTTTRTINRILKVHAPFVIYYRSVPSMYGNRFLDYVGTSYGHGFVIEAKRQDKEATDHQTSVMKDWWAAGAAVFEITGEVEHYVSLSEWLVACSKAPMPNIRPVWIPRQIEMLQTPK